MFLHTRVFANLSENSPKWSTYSFKNIKFKQSTLKCHKGGLIIGGYSVVHTLL